MKQKELIKIVQKETKLEEKNIRSFLSSFKKEITNALANGEEIKIRNLGRFTVKERKERKCYNLHTKKVEVMSKKKCAAFHPSLLLSKVRIEIPSVLELLKGRPIGGNSQINPFGTISKGSPHFPPITTPTHSNTLYPTSGGNIIIPNLAIGARRDNVNTEEVIQFEYWGNVINGFDKMDSLSRENYPFVLIPLTGTPILACTPFDGTVNGVSEPKLYHELRRLRKIEPEIRILKNVSLPIKNRNYGYKPDIAIVWKSKGICIDVEIDEPYDILSRKPIHYTDKECSDYLRNAYLLENGWYVVRIAEEQVVKHIEEMYAFVARLVFLIANDERFNIRTEKVESRKRWTRDEAKEMAENNYREEYLGLPPIKAITLQTNDEEINRPDSFDFIPPKTDIVNGYYEELKGRLKLESEKYNYLRIKRTGNGYEYITTNNQMQLLFHDVKLFDFVENKEYDLSYSDIDSYIGMEDIKIIKDKSQRWHYFIFDAIVHCRPIHFIYSKTSESGPTERTVLYLTPYIYYSSSAAQKYFENHTKWEWLNGVSWHMYKDLCNKNNMPEFTGYCTYRKDVRTFNALRILEGFAYDCYKPLALYDSEDVLEVLVKGDGKLAEIIYLHFTEEKKKLYHNIRNYGHALVMQGKTEEALKQYRLFPKDKSLSNGQTWNEAIFEDIDSYIAKDIHKEEFERVKKELELLNT